MAKYSLNIQGYQVDVSAKTPASAVRRAHRQLSKLGAPGLKALKTDERTKWYVDVEILAVNDKPQRVVKAKHIGLHNDN